MIWIFYADDDMLSQNDMAMKDAYRSKIGLLTSGEITSIRKRCGVSPKELSLLLGWDAETIEEYEGHHVQDADHDAILRKLAVDPKQILAMQDGGERNESEDTEREPASPV